MLTESRSMNCSEEYRVENVSLQWHTASSSLASHSTSSRLVQASWPTLKSLPSLVLLEHDVPCMYVCVCVDATGFPASKGMDLPLAPSCSIPLPVGWILSGALLGQQQHCACRFGSGKLQGSKPSFSFILKWNRIGELPVILKRDKT